MYTTWLRWWDQAGNLLLWGQEHLDFERQRVEEEKQRVEQERQRAEQAELALEQERITQQKLLAKLKALGVEPDEVWSAGGDRHSVPSILYNQGKKSL